MRLAILSAVLFLSGISALIFETLWLRLSGLVFGNSVWSVALILSSFMAGLALGNGIAASFKSLRLRPLFLYALLEITIALFGCTIVFTLPALGDVMQPIFRALWNHDAILNAIRLTLSFLILLLPTTAMGLTLPVLIDDAALKRHQFGRALGFLYGANTLGAVAGALLGEAFLIKAFGLFGTSLFAGALNLAAAVIAALIAIGASNVDLAPRSSSSPQINSAAPWRLLFLGMASGGLLLCLEVVWFRFLRLYIASSPTAFATMLAVVLAAIAAGSAAAGAFSERVTRSAQSLSILFLLAALATLLSYAFFPTPALQAGEIIFYIENWARIAFFSAALMFPTAFVSGILFPSIAAQVQAHLPNRMNSAGLVTLFNTIGAAIGPLLASFVLLPALGFQSALIFCAAFYAALSILAGNSRAFLARSPASFLTLALTLVLVLSFAFFPYRRDEMHFFNARRDYENSGLRLVKKIEGTSDTWQLLRRDLFGQPFYYRLLANAFSMSATNPRNQRYMRTFAYLPASLRAQTQDALLICYGVGVTADALVCNPELRQIDIVDISREVFTLADFYGDSAHPNPLHDARVTKFVQDGRFFLQASPRRYDIITGEPPPPKVAGSVNLYTEQFFALMKSRLQEGGIATFWLPIYQLRVDEVKAILRAFHNAFPNTLVFASSDQDWIMTGIKDPLPLVSANELSRFWQNETTRADLVRIGMERPEQFSALFVMDGDEIDRITADTKPLTDFFPKRLSDAPADLAAIDQFAWNYMEAPSALRRFQSSPLIEKIWPEKLRRDLEPFFIVREARYRSRSTPGNEWAQLDLYLRHSQLRTPVLEVLQSDEFRVALAKKVAAQSNTPPPETWRDLIADRLAARDFPGAIQLLERETETGFKPREDFFLLVYLYCLNGNIEKAETLAAAHRDLIEKSALVDWLWEKLRMEFGFRPPG